MWGLFVDIYVFLCGELVLCLHRQCCANVMMASAYPANTLPDVGLLQLIRRGNGCVLLRRMNNEQVDVPGKCRMIVFICAVNHVFDSCCVTFCPTIA